MGRKWLPNLGRAGGTVTALAASVTAYQANPFLGCILAGIPLVFLVLLALSVWTAVREDDPDKREAGLRVACLLLGAHAKDYLPSRRSSGVRSATGAGEPT
ncbi:hypothetical protein GCM10023196_016080 [Actinoallomurus vinaceus]|uniref:Major facilitator superfamily (MFS) profile domain-containing protein n=2 Tax=Actinoallomurus vinaceus TaxID=1080074 RepID=A0ABP8U6I1_9ACTN